MLKCIEDIKRPILYISLSVIISSVIYGVYSINKWFAVISAGLFFIFILKKTNKYFVLIIFGFFIIQFVNNYCYYNDLTECNVQGSIKIVKEYNGCYLGKINNRKVYINNIEKNIIPGKVLMIKGEIKKETDIEKGIVGNIKVKKYKIKKDSVFNKIFSLRNMVFEKLKSNLGQRKAALVCSMAFGYKDYLDAEDEEEMRNLGIIHVISVSGLHVAFIFLILKKLIGGKGAIALLFLYIILTGAAVSSIRAFIMMFLLVLSKEIKKNYYSIAALSISALYSVILQVYIVFDIGFMLSYLAVLGIILYNKKLNYKLYKIPKYIRETMALSISAQVFTIPVLIFYFNEISIFSLLGNLIIVPIVNVIIILGNVLIPLIPFDILFDFNSYLLLKVIRVLDYVMDKFYDFSKYTFFVNKDMVIVYAFVLISIFFIKKGYKKFYILPFIAYFVVMIKLYSPIPKVDYIKDAGILVSYRGNINILSHSNTVDGYKLKRVYMADNIYRNILKMKIRNDIEIIPKDKNYILKIRNKEYYLILNNKKSLECNYDIINFINVDIEGFYILNDKIIEY